MQMPPEHMQSANVNFITKSKVGQMSRSNIFIYLKSISHEVYTYVHKLLPTLNTQAKRTHTHMLKTICPTDLRYLGHKKCVLRFVGKKRGCRLGGEGTNNFRVSSLYVTAPGMEGFVMMQLRLSFYTNLDQAARQLIKTSQ